MAVFEHLHIMFWIDWTSARRSQLDFWEPFFFFLPPPFPPSGFKLCCIQTQIFNLDKLQTGGSELNFVWNSWGLHLTFLEIKRNNVIHYRFFALITKFHSGKNWENLSCIIRTIFIFLYPVIEVLSFPPERRQKCTCSGFFIYFIISIYLKFQFGWEIMKITYVSYFLQQRTLRGAYIFTAQLHLCCWIKMIKMPYNKTQDKFLPETEIIYGLNI